MTLGFTFGKWVDWPMRMTRVVWRLDPDATTFSDSREAVLAWFRDVGADPSNVAARDVFATTGPDGLRLRFLEFERDGSGRRVLDGKSYRKIRRAVPIGRLPWFARSVAAVGRPAPGPWPEFAAEFWDAKADGRAVPQNLAAALAARVEV